MEMIVFTDLDGSLLNHEDYSFAEAMPALARIKSSGIPLIMTTSKTRREVEALQWEMGVREPFIVENGGGIFFPSGTTTVVLPTQESISTMEPPKRGAVERPGRFPRDSST